MGGLFRIPTFFNNKNSQESNPFVEKKIQTWRYLALIPPQDTGDVVTSQANNVLLARL